ncbi:MAG: hypothetical protein KDD99_08700, partial [Bacteroidetes bacterium]|nr:hypothetical protein [Bacteroidota bacterium]
MSFRFLFSLLLAHICINLSPDILMSKTYYIRPSGNDNHTGTSPQTAWKSIEKVNQTRLNPGDSILFEGGKTFFGNLIIGDYGHQLEKAPVYIGSFGKQKAIIRAGKGNGIYVFNTGGIHIEDLEIRGDGREKNLQHGIIFYRNAD